MASRQTQFPELYARSGNLAPPSSSSSTSLDPRRYSDTRLFFRRKSSVATQQREYLKKNVKLKPVPQDALGFGRVSRRAKNPRLVLPVVFTLGFLILWIFRPQSASKYVVNPATKYVVDPVLNAARAVPGAQNLANRVVSFATPLESAILNRIHPTEQGPVDLDSLPKHVFHPNGLLLVNPHGRHPIDVLIEDAEKKWEKLNAKQSTNLRESAEEYRRRYRRNPPKGYDKWWEFVERHDIELPDEYDQINKDLEPFWALDPADFKHRAKVMQERGHTFVMAVKDGKVTRHGEHKDIERATDLEQLLGMVAEWIPGEVNMSIIIDDNPAVLLGHGTKEMLLDLARIGDTTTSPTWGFEDEALSNFAKSCPPKSAIRHKELGEEFNIHDPTERTFIHDHRAAMDICAHPEWFHLHGTTTNGGVEIGDVVPLFAWSKTNLHSDILITPLEQISPTTTSYMNTLFDPDFFEKKHDTCVWRGRTTGSDFRTDVNWRISQRVRLYDLANDVAGKSSILYSVNGTQKAVNMSNTELNDKYMDVSWVDTPVQCDEETCKIMSDTMRFLPFMQWGEALQYRYAIDIDGNAWSGRFFRLLFSKALVLKSTLYPEWYTDRLVPWYHYVPVKLDYSDIYDIMAYFEGTPDGQGGHQQLAEKIGLQGREFARKNWRYVDMASYMFRLLLEFGRLLQQNEGDWDYVD